MSDSPSIIVLNTQMPKGPQMSQKSSYIQYVKDCSSSYIQQESERNYEDFIRQEMSENQIHLAPTIIKTGENNINIQFTQIAKRKKIIEKFKNNLLQYAYVIPQLLKNKFMNIENYIQKDQQHIKKNHFNSQKLNQQHCIISPSNVYLFYWEQISLIVQIISLWICALIIGFPKEDSLNYQNFGIIFICVTIIEIIITLNRQIYFKGQLISNRLTIIQTYFIKQSFLDCISIIIWIMITFGVNIQEETLIILSIFQLFAIFIRIYKMYDSLAEQSYLRGFEGYSFELLTLIISTYFFAHIVACFWIMIGKRSQNEKMTWIRDNQLENDSIWTLYNNAFYWATMTMVTVGYGDITPKNNYEMIYANCIMFLSSCVFAYSMNSIGILLKGYNDIKQSYKKSVIVLNKYLKDNNVDDQIQNKILNCLKFLIQNQDNDNNDALKIINKLSLGLQQELNSNILEKIISNIKVLQFNFTKQTLQDLQNCVQIRNFSPGEYIQQSSSIKEQELCYIIKGSVNFVQAETNQIIYVLNSGETFNQYEFFTGMLNHNINIISNNFSQILKLNKTDFLKLINESQQDWEIYHSIKDNVMNNNNWIDLYYKCQFCLRGNHLRNNCPLLSYQPNLANKLKKENLQKNNQFRYKKQRLTLKLNSWIISQEVQSSVQQYQTTNFQENIEPLSRKISRISECDINEETLLKIDQINQLQERQQKQKKNTYNQQQNQGSSTYIQLGLNRINIGTPLKVKNLQINEISKQNSSQATQQFYSQQQLNSTHSFKMLEKLKDTQFISFNIDKFHNYRYYLPQNNIKRILLQSFNQFTYQIKHSQKALLAAHLKLKGGMKISSHQKQ